MCVVPVPEWIWENDSNVTVRLDSLMSCLSSWSTVWWCGRWCPASAAGRPCDDADVDVLPQQLVDRVMMRAFISLYSSHYKTTVLRAGELTIKTLAGVSRSWWKAVARWSDSAPGLQLKRKNRCEIDSEYHRVIFSLIPRPGISITKWHFG